MDNEQRIFFYSSVFSNLHDRQKGFFSLIETADFSIFLSGSLETSGMQSLKKIDEEQTLDKID